MKDFFFPDSDAIMETLEAGKCSRKIRARGGKLMIVEVFFNEGGIGAEHRHEHEQIMYCISGEFEFSLEGKKTIVRPGDSIFFPANVLHGARCIKAGSVLDIFTPQREDFLKKS